VNRIVDLQRRLRERGRIRIGYSVPSTRPGAKPGTKVPKKLDRFRFTAPDRQTIELVAQLYGGAPEAWPDRGDDQWQVTTDARQLPVVFATRVAFSQSYEAWQGGFLVRICDGETAHVPSTSRRMRSEACSCDPEERVCKITTHLGLILPELPGLGTWRLVTHGYYAATELLGAVELIEGAIAHGLVRVPARLMVEKREVRRLVDDKPKVHRFAVPVLDLDIGVMALEPTGAGLLAGGPRALPAATAVELEAPVREPRGWKAVDQQALPEAPAVSVAERVAEVDKPRPRRANSAPEIPRTGTKPRPAGDVDTVCGVCGRPYGRDPVRRDPEPERGRFAHVACLDAQPETARNSARPVEPDDEPGEPDEPPPAAAVEDDTLVKAIVDDLHDDDDDQADEDDDELEELDDEEELDEEAFARALGLTDDEDAEGDEPSSGPDDGDGPGAGHSGPVVRAGPATRQGAAMTFGQQRKMMALAGEAFPVPAGANSQEADDIRKRALLQLAGLCGQWGLTSRTQISSATAVPLIDVLQAIVDGAFAFDDGEVTDTRTGELVTFEAPR
jgi:Recombination directionality factor-like